MGFTVSASTGHMFENREQLRSTAKTILARSTSEENAEKIIEKTIFNVDSQIKDSYINSQLAIIRASSQISVNNSLKETLRYLNSHPSKKVHKEPVLGELWNLYSKVENESYQGELLDFEIDKNAVNIFAA